MNKFVDGNKKDYLVLPFERPKDEGRLEGWVLEGWVLEGWVVDGWVLEGWVLDVG